MNITFTKQTPHNNRIYNPGATIIVSEKEGMKYISAGHAIENVSAVIRAAGGGTTGVAQVNSDWAATTGVAEILNKPLLDFDKYEWWNLQGVSRVSNYGALYNWFTATDARNIANTGWHISTAMELSTMVSTGVFKEVGLTHWASPNTGATNSEMFNARGNGRRGALGVYELLTQYFMVWSPDTSAENGVGYFFSYNNTSLQTSFAPKYYGHGIRLVKDTTSLSDGQTGTYTGNDGSVYRTICIGTQEWLADNLYETKFRNGDLIPNVTDNTAWAALITAGMCYYNNDKANAYTDSPVTIPIHSHDLLELQMTGGEIIATATSTGAMITVTVTGVTPASIGATTSYSATLGNGVLTSIPITHNLNTRKIIAMVYNTTTFEVIMCDVVVTSVNTVTLGFSVAPATAQYTINIIGG